MHLNNRLIDLLSSLFGLPLITSLGYVTQALNGVQDDHSIVYPISPYKYSVIAF